MMFGVWIDEKNTLTDFGLALLADLSIGTPEARTTYVTIPEADGDLDLTAALTGGQVRYGMRKISFELYPVHDIVSGKKTPATELHAAMIRQKLAGYINGQKRKVWFPDDLNHYFIGRLQMGDKGGYNNVGIPVTMTAEPWRYKSNETVRKYTSGSGEIILWNEGKNTVPVITYDGPGGSIEFEGKTYALEPFVDNVFDDLVLKSGANRIGITSASADIEFRYQEAVI